ncbi:MAG TPA: hypothetical protein VFO39_14690 [Candidatus Sulfotelmatobacter sp.]|nr:hypothetical protein [Candidatus Sulfotelmatobacter sp.]
MKRVRTRIVQLSAAASALLALAWVLVGQASSGPSTRVGLPTDWSHRHLVFSRPANDAIARELAQEPRFWQQQLRRNQVLRVNGNEKSPTLSAMLPMQTKTVTRLRKDWSVNLGSSASVGQAVFPAKFSFDVTTAKCASDPQPDFVVFPTGVLSSGTQASIVAYDNLYSGCTGTVPSTFWAYDTSGQVLTSPVISLDGTQVAFVQTIGSAQLVLLKWAASNTETSTSPLHLPTNVSPSAYTTCTAPCMTLINLADGTDDNSSSIFYDFKNDIAWVGGTNEVLHKITPVFKGTTANPPAEITTGGFPSQMSGLGNALSSPLFDRITQQVFVGDLGGFLYRVNASTGAVVQSGQLDFNPAVALQEGVMLDASVGQLLAFSSSDGTSNCGGGTVACAAIFALSTSFVAGDTGTEVAVGDSVVADGVTVPNSLFSGGFDSTYINSANGTGNLYVCGQTGANPIVYRIPIAATVLGAPLTVATLAPAVDAPSCSPLTDVPNPNTTGGASERVFFSVTNNGSGPGCGGSGCVMSVITTPWQASTSFTLGQRIMVVSSTTVPTVEILVDVAGGTSGAIKPNWPSTGGKFVTDGSVTWLVEGPVRITPYPAWVANKIHLKGDRILDGNGNIEVVTTAGTSAATLPTFNPTIGQPTTDNTVTWTNAGPLPTSFLKEAGGTSGIIVDNVSTFTGGSQVYFSTIANQACSIGGTGGCGVQASQTGLN